MIVNRAQTGQRPVLRRNLREAFTTELSDPVSFNQDNFLLAVHSVNPVMAGRFRQSFKATGRYEAARDVDLLKSPQRLREKGVLSASIVSAQHSSTFGRLLFLIGFGFDDVLSTTTEDSISNQREPELRNEPPGATLSPRQMVEQSVGDQHNEVVLDASGAYVTGVGIKTMIMKDGTHERPEDTERMRQLSAELKVPFVEIMEFCHLPDLGPKVQRRFHDNGLDQVYLQRDGVGYSFVNDEDLEVPFCRYFHSSGNDLEPLKSEDYAKIRPELELFLSQDAELKEFLTRIDQKMDE